MSSSGRHPAVIVSEELGEDARRESGHAGVGQDVAEPLDVEPDRPVVADQSFGSLVAIRCPVLEQPHEGTVSHR